MVVQGTCVFSFSHLDLRYSWLGSTMTSSMTPQSHEDDTGAATAQNWSEMMIMGSFSLPSVRSTPVIMFRTPAFAEAQATVTFTLGIRRTIPEGDGFVSAFRILQKKFHPSTRVVAKITDIATAPSIRIPRREAMRRTRITTTRRPPVRKARMERPRDNFLICMHHSTRKSATTS